MNKTIQDFNTYCEQHPEFAASLKNMSQDQLIAAIQAEGFNFTYAEYLDYFSQERPLSSAEVNAINAGVDLDGPENCSDFCLHLACKTRTDCPNFSKCPQECIPECGAFCT